jgi:hypothetical protein
MKEEAPDPGDLFALPEDGAADDPRPIAAQLVAECAEFNDLRLGEAAVLFLFRMETKDKNGKAVLGEMCLPRFQGSLAPLATWLLAKVCDGIPDFLMILDRQWWVQADRMSRTALVFHELLHCTIAADKEGEQKFTDDGRPVWAIRPHDVEVFNEEVARFGAWHADIAAFIAAAREGGA